MSVEETCADRRRYPSGLTDKLVDLSTVSQFREQQRYHLQPELLLLHRLWQIDVDETRSRDPSGALIEDPMDAFIVPEVLRHVSLMTPEHIVHDEVGQPSAGKPRCAGWVL